MKKVILIPDLHGRRFWKEAVAAAEADTRIIFLGDYTDPYGFEEITEPEAFDNFVEVVDYARSHPNVELLLGNHDCGYIFGRTICNCRTDRERFQEIRDLFLDNVRLFNFCTDVVISGKRYIVSHAGINLYWLENFSREIFEDGRIDYDTLCLRVNNCLRPILMSSRQLTMLQDVSRHRGGISPYGSIVWTDIDEFEDSDVHIPIDQIVGHTLQAFEEFKDDDYSIFYGGVNIKKGPESTVYCIDTAEAYFLDEEGVLRYMRNDKSVEENQDVV